MLLGNTRSKGEKQLELDQAFIRKMRLESENKDK
jgi:hypothetical protein